MPDLFIDTGRMEDGQFFIRGSHFEKHETTKRRDIDKNKGTKTRNYAPPPSQILTDTVRKNLQPLVTPVDGGSLIKVSSFVEQANTPEGLQSVLFALRDELGNLGMPINALIDSRMDPSNPLMLKKLNNWNIQLESILTIFNAVKEKANSSNDATILKAKLTIETSLMKMGSGIAALKKMVSSRG